MTVEPGRPPLISVTLPVFNNAAHVGAAIASILDQTMGDFELIVVDDGSLDETVERVRDFDDPRIVLLTQSNHGGAHATNRAVAAARGRYIALFAGDDVSRPQRLERQLSYLQQSGARAVYTWADFIDDAGVPITGPHFAQGYFNHPRRTRPEMLRHFFFNGNYLCTVSALIERDLLLSAGPFPDTSAQLPDFAVWCRLLRKHELHVLPEPLVAYRIRANGANVSSPRNAVRAHFELVQVHRAAFRDLPEDLFRAAFAADLRNPDFTGSIAQDIELAFLWLRHPVLHLRQLGLERLHYLLQEPPSLEVAETDYEFGLPDLMLLTSTMDVINATEYLQTRDELQRLTASRDHVLAEYRRLEAYTRRVIPAKDEEIARLRAAHGTVEDTHHRLEDYTLRTLAAKDEEIASLRAAHGTVEDTYHRLEDYTLRTLAAKDEEIASLRAAIPQPTPANPPSQSLGHPALTRTGADIIRSLMRWLRGRV